MGTKTELPDTKQKGHEAEETSFAETAMRLGGKSETEARKMGAVDRADDQVEALFAAQYQTHNSPAHRVIWDKEVPLSLFMPEAKKVSDKCQTTMTKSQEVLKKHRDAGTVYDEKKKVSKQVLEELGSVGYWGMLVDEEYGGQGAPMTAFGPFLTRMATIEATTAGLASVHGCIGAVDPIRTFGTAEQKKKFLPMLASGERLSAFALTEPCAGSDLTALRTTAKLEGDHYVVNGEKLFITNALPGRLIGLVCLIDNKPAVLIVDLPPQENDNFYLRTYGLYALKHTHNNGLVFKNFRVPKENLLEPARGDGLTIAYHGLNYGRVALCATAAGNMRMMLSDMLPWAHFRKTYGEAIERRELVQRRMGSMAGLIVACDALTNWCGWLLDEGYRGEMECVIAKIFGSESQKTAAIEYYMKTHGGRSFVHGHGFGDNVHEFLAPCIYEGEGEMLGMAFFKSLVKMHGKTYFEPIGKALQKAGIKVPNPANPMHAMTLSKVAMPYFKWWGGQMMGGWSKPTLPPMPKKLQEHAEFALEALHKGPREISGTMFKHQLKLADRQCRMAELSIRLQELIVMLVTSLHAAKTGDEVVQMAADVVCQDIARKVTGKRADDGYYRTVTKLGGMIAEGGFKSINGAGANEILFSYEN
jgi:alkylation response protein AidB-like acyl-CoA dehydrogenase